MIAGVSEHAHVQSEDSISWLTLRLREVTLHEGGSTVVIPESLPLPDNSIGMSSLSPAAANYSTPLTSYSMCVVACTLFAVAVYYSCVRHWTQVLIISILYLRVVRRHEVDISRYSVSTASTECLANKDPNVRLDFCLRTYLVFLWTANDCVTEPHPLCTDNEAARSQTPPPN